MEKHLGRNMERPVKWDRGDVPLHCTAEPGIKLVLQVMVTPVYQGKSGELILPVEADMWGGELWKGGQASQVEG